ncbi:hypothetical protein WR25_11955 [Diploscapter pachys]|uniref:TATA-box-binding protein n=1 Tax=Diploscapter pachys TaxID=2018661 RepID=A0A2A2LKD2_9BILA|nr:hypothetical protein WR25_11955 [Diploscapter pachys]
MRNFPAVCKAGGSAHASVGGPQSDMGMNLNINPSSVINVGGGPESVFADMNPGSVGPNLAVPMTPLVSDLYVRKSIQMPASNLPAAMMPQVQNMVGSCDVRFLIQLEGLHYMHQRFTTHEAELFPGLIYRMVKPRVVLLIFVSGKVVITGAKFKKEIDDAFNQIYPILKGFKK